MPRHDPKVCSRCSAPILWAQFLERAELGRWSRVDAGKEIVRRILQAGAGVRGSAARQERRVRGAAGRGRVAKIDERGHVPAYAPLAGARVFWYHAGPRGGPVVKLSSTAKRAKTIAETGQCPDKEHCPHKHGKQLWTVWVIKEVFLPLVPILVIFIHRTTKLEPGALHGWALFRELARGPEIPFVSVLLLGGSIVEAFGTYRSMATERRLWRNCLAVVTVVLAVLTLYVGSSLLSYSDVMLAYQRSTEALAAWTAGGGVGPRPTVMAYPTALLDEWTTTHLWYLVVAVALSASTQLFTEWLKKHPGRV